MRVLYVCHRFPFPPRRGGKIRPFNTIAHLAERHEVTVCSLVRSDAEAVEGAGLAAHCVDFEMGRVSNPVQAMRMLARLPTTQPSSMGFFYSPDLASRIERLLTRRQFDLIFVHCSSVAQYVSHVTGVPKILDFGDMDSQKWLDYVHHKPFPLKLGYWLEGRKLLREERRLAGLFEVCTATTCAEWETLRSLGTARASDWFPNGVDARYFEPGDDTHDPDVISFVGRMDYYPNQQAMLDFCDRTWPLLRARRPTMQLFIVGADPSRTVRRLSKRPGVTVTGSVPDVRPYVRRSVAMVAPLAIARGTQNKILEAMALGVPVVCSKVAAGGVDAEDGEHFLVTDTPEACAEAVMRLVDHPAERARLGRAGRERMLSHHAWSRSMERLDAIIERCVDRHRATETNLQ